MQNDETNARGIESSNFRKHGMKSNDNYFQVKIAHFYIEIRILNIDKIFGYKCGSPKWQKQYIVYIADVI